MPQGVVSLAIVLCNFEIFMGKVGQCIEEQLEEERQDGGVIRTSEEEGLWTLLFADDTKAAGALKSNKQMGRLQKILDKFFRWTQENDMLVNAGKTECLRIGNLQLQDPEQ